MADLVEDARFTVIDTPLSSLRVIERRARGDERGFLARLYAASTWRALGFSAPIIEINHTLTRCQGTVRGMHYQVAPSAEDKFVTVIRGSIYDVAVDLRAGSATQGLWHGETLSAANGRAMLIPKGFAHGFQTLEDDCELIYFHTAAYDARHEGGVSPIDPALGIAWPLPIAQMSDRDRGFAPLDINFQGIVI